MQVCDLDVVCLHDYWVTSSTSSPQDKQWCEFRIVPTLTDATITLTDTDISGVNPCIEFDDYGCGIVVIEMRCASPTCSDINEPPANWCWGDWVPRTFRNCCLTADINCN